jgi:hypothetical protein
MSHKDDTDVMVKGKVLLLREPNPSLPTLSLMVTVTELSSVATFSE